MMSLLLRQMGWGLASAIAMTTFSVNAARESVLVMDLRANRGAATEYCERNPTLNCTTAQVGAREFSNGNTFVQVESKLANKNVVVLMPASLDSDAFMEALLEIHTAHTWGARRIEVVCERKPEVRDGDKLLFRGAELNGLLALAGADFLTLPDDVMDLSASNRRPSRGTRQTFPSSIVMSINHPKLGQEIASHLKLDHIEADAVAEAKWPRHQQVIFVATVDQPTNRKFFEALKVARRLKALNNKVMLIVPYFPYVRSDKIDQSGVSVGGKLAADLIEAAGADLAGFVKLHAPQAQGFFRIPTLHIETRDSINARLVALGVEAVVSPDTGFQKEATLYASKLGLPVFVINKQRDPKTGEAALQKMGEFDVKGKHLAIIDDETASGSTLASSAEFLKKQGAAKIYAFVTHLAGDAGKAIESKYLDGLYVTDTFPLRADLPSPQVQVIPVSVDIARALSDFVDDCEASLIGEAKL